ncbi:hypothetical protein MRX96_002975 [Rhipicephalus microplus]
MTLSHVLWLKTTRQGRLLVNRLYALPHSSMRQQASELLTVVLDMQYSCSPAIPPYHHIPMVITKTIGGIKAKVRNLLAAMQQECSTLLHEQLDGRLLVYVEGSRASPRLRGRRLRCAISRHGSQVPPLLPRLLHWGGTRRYKFGSRFPE